MKKFTKKINYYYRIIATGIAFSYFGIGSLILASLIIPSVKLFNKKDYKRQKKIKTIVHYNFKFFVGLMQFLGLINVKVKDKKLFENIKGCVVIANHPSLIDVVIFISLIKNHNSIVKAGLWNNFYMKNIVRELYISNALNPEDLLQESKKALNRGENIIIFPEGTRTTPGKSSKIQRGAARIALYSKKDLLPVKIKCEPIALLKNQKWYHIADEKMQYEFIPKPSIKIKNYDTKPENEAKTARKLTSDIKDILELI